VTQRKNFLGRTNRGFACEHCGAEVLPLARGGFRNHCPHCLWSKHVDRVPGDRAESCCGLMPPVGVESDAKRGWMIVLRCLRCGFTRRSRAALADPRQPDDFEAMLAVARRASGRTPPAD
jgi:DNA-directed RNA polymerase subunit RPC12/RpoP